MSSKSSNENGLLPDALELEVTPYSELNRSSHGHSPFKWRQRFLSPEKINKNKKKILSPGYLIDNDTLNILTNNIEDFKVLKSSRTRNIVQKDILRNRNQNHFGIDHHPMNENDTNFTREGDVRSITQDSSLPALSDAGSRSAMPKRIAPLATLLNSTVPRNMDGTVCCLCNEPLQNLLIKGNVIEKIVELQCSHFCHEDCYNIAIEFQTTKENQITEENDGISPQEDCSSFPDCKCGNKAIPIDDNLRMHFISQSLLKKSNQRRFIGSRKNQISHQNSLKTGSGFVLSHGRKPSRGSSISAISSIISSVNRSPTPSPTSSTNPIRGTHRDERLINSRAPLALMRSKIISKLIDDCSSHQGRTNDISENFIDSLGLLRLLDELTVSIDKRNLEPVHSYLFSYLILFVENGMQDFMLIPLIEEDNHRFSGIKKKIAVEFNSSSSLKITVDSKEEILFNTDNPSILERWALAFQNSDLLFPNGSITNTIVVGHGKYTNTLEQSNTPLLYPPRRSPVKNMHSINNFVSTKKHINLIAAPKSVILIANLSDTFPQVLPILKNIVRALSMIKIDVLLVLTSAKMLRSDSNYATQRFFKHTEDDSIHDQFWDNLNLDMSTTDDNLTNLAKNFLKTNGHLLKDTSTVVVSSYPIREFQTPTKINLMMEVGVLNHRSPGYVRNVVNVASWDDVMETMCGTLGLDFDIINASDTETETDANGEVSPVKKSGPGFTLHNNNSTVSTTTESDSDAEVIYDLLAEYQKAEEESLSTPQQSSEAVFQNDADTIINGIDNSSLTPRLRNNGTESSPVFTESPHRWSELISDVGKAVDESRALGE